MKLLAACAIVLLLACAGYASNASIAYRSNTGTCGINCPKIKDWNNATGLWGSEIELGSSTGAAIREAKIYYSPVNQKRIVVAENDNGEIDTYVSWTGAAWNQTRNLTDLWGAAPAVHYRGFDLAFETATGDAVLIFSVVNANAACDLGYVIIRANETTNSSAYGCIDYTGNASDLTFRWVAADPKPVAGSEEIIVAATEATTDDVPAWVWNGSAWGNEKQVSINATTTGDFEAIGVKYAADGSAAMVAAGDGANGFINYSYWKNTAWTAVASFDVDTGDTVDVRWITIKADPATDDLLLTEVDSGSDLGAAYWNGTTWAMTSNIDTAVDSASVRAADYSWNPSGSTGGLVWDTDTTGTTLSNRTFSGGAFGGTTTFSTYAGTGAWMQMVRNPNATDAVKFLGARLNSNFDIGSFNFTGTAYANLGDSAITADTTAITFEAMGIAFVLAFDTAAPTVSGTAVNDTSLNINEDICVNASAIDQNGVPIHTAKAQIAYPGGTVSNVTLSDTGCNAGGVGDGRFGATVNVGGTSGTLTVNTTFANDSFGNMGWQSPYPNLQVTVASGIIVDTTISASTLSFGSLNPATNDNPATENPLVLTNTANSNTAIDVYLNNTNMTAGANKIGFGNLSVNTTNSAAGSKALNGSTFINGTSANTGFVENLAVSGTVNLYFWHDVPAAQNAGAYASTVVVHSIANGEAP